MISFLNYYLIAVPQIYDEGDIHGIKKLNSLHYIDKERDRYERKIRKGIVITKPLGYTQANHMPLDPGIPRYRLHIGHDAISGMVEKGYPWGVEYYHPGLKEGLEYVTKADYGARHDAEEGEEIYFHPSVTEEENYQGEHLGMKLYRCDVHELIFSLGRAQGFWVMVSPIGESTDRGEFQIEEQDQLLEGVVKFVHPSSVLKTGDRVYFQQDSNWDFEIEGVRYYAMEEENVMMRRK